jgi:hypothetical protein
VQRVRDKAVVLRKPITVSPLHKSGKVENNKCVLLHFLVKNKVLVTSEYRFTDSTTLSGL